MSEKDICLHLVCLDLIDDILVQKRSIDKKEPFAFNISCSDVLFELFELL